MRFVSRQKQESNEPMKAYERTHMHVPQRPVRAINIIYHINRKQLLNTLIDKHKEHINEQKQITSK